MFMLTVPVRGTAFAVAAAMLGAAPLLAQDAAPPQAQASQAQAAAPSETQDSTPAAAPVPASECEFHVWPGDRMKWAVTGWWRVSSSGPIYREGAPAIPSNPVDAAAQIEIMVREQPQQHFAGKAGYRLVAHDAPLPSLAIRGATGRLSDSTSPCYAELIVDDLAFAQDPFSGARLRTLFRYRDFGPDAEPQRSFSTWGEVDLTAFPPQRQDQYDASMAELRHAFRNNILAFAVHANRPPRPRR